MSQFHLYHSFLKKKKSNIFSNQYLFTIHSAYYMYKQSIQFNIKNKIKSCLKINTLLLSSYMYKHLFTVKHVSLKDWYLIELYHWLVLVLLNQTQEFLLRHLWLDLKPVQPQYLGHHLKQSCCYIPPPWFLRTLFPLWLVLVDFLTDLL